MSEQLKLTLDQLDEHARAVARRSDPDTSWEAARSVQKIRESQLAVYNLLVEIGPSTDVRIALHYNRYPQGSRPRQSESGLRTRRSELVELGLVQDSGKRAVLGSGRRAIVWEISGSSSA